ncbi:hypothetical protein GCM10028800_14770 [Nesterenkonia populi]
MSAMRKGLSPPPPPPPIRRGTSSAPVTTSVMTSTAATPITAKVSAFSRPNIPGVLRGGFRPAPGGGLGGWGGAGG